MYLSRILQVIRVFIILTLSTTGALGVAGESLVFKFPGDVYYQLEENNGAVQWVPASAADLNSPEQNRPQGEVVFPGGTVRVTNKDKVEIFEGGTWRDSGLRPPPAGITYEAAHLDSKGNVAVELGGNGHGVQLRH